MDHLNELKTLDFPQDKFAIFGSGPMAIRGIRESHDIDIIVKYDLWDELEHKYPSALHQNPTCLKLATLKSSKIGRHYWAG